MLKNEPIKVMKIVAEFNIYLALTINGFVSGLAGAAGAWAYNAWIKKHADKLHKRLGGKRHG